MTPEDRRHWDAVQEWKAKRFDPDRRRIVPPAWREKVRRVGASARDRAGEAAERFPVAEKVAQAFREALEGLVDAGARAGAATVRHEAVLKAYRKRGHDVDDLAAVRALGLAAILTVKPRLDLGYIAASAAQGAGTGLLASGGTMVAAGVGVATGGVGAAPGVGVLVGALATDAAATVVASNRAVGHVAAYYGHDVDDPGERLFALAVLNMGLADGAGKVAAYRELHGLVRALARRQTWKQLQRNQIARVGRALFQSLGENLTQRKLGQALPVVGVAVGAGLNAKTLARVVDDAEHLYLERHLREKYEIGPEAQDAVNDGLVEIVEAEIEAAPDGSRRAQDRFPPHPPEGTEIGDDEAVGVAG